MPQPRERQQQQESNQQDQSPNKQGRHPQHQKHEAQESGKHPNPDRYPDQGKQAQKPSDVQYPEQDPSGKAERPDAVEGADASRPDDGLRGRGQRDRDLN
jgi:hypothetical protein